MRKQGTTASLVLLVCLTGVLGAVTASAAAALSFTAPIDYGVGGRPVGIATADLNDDGRPDLVATSRAGLSILLWKGQGRFAPARRGMLEHVPGAVAIGDVNGDGALDAVTVCFDDDTLTVLLGDRKGGFVVAGTFPTGDGPANVAIGDLTGDGVADVATADFAAGSVSILRGDDTGALQPPLDIVTGARCGRLLCADFNLDGTMDLAYSRYEWEEYAGFGILLADGAGGFTPTGTYETGGADSSPHGLALINLNDDAKPDIVVLQGYEGGYIRSFLGDGLGTFLSAGRTDFIGGMADALGLAVADMDQRFGTDVVTSAVPDGVRPTRIYLLLRTGWGSVSFKPTWFLARRTVGELVAADFNGDRKIDLAWTDLNSRNVSVRLNGALPRLAEVSPPQARVGSVVTLTGTRFLKRGGTVRFGGRTANSYVSWSNTLIKVRVPSGTPAGRVNVTVTTVIGQSAPRYFTRL